MNTISTLLALLLLQASLQSLPGDRELGSVSDPDGTTRTYRVTYERLDRAPSWDPDKGPPPLPMDRATAVGRDWLLAHNPKFEAFRPAVFSLLRISEGNGAQQWIWTIHFDARLGNRWLDHMGFEVYILMGGTVVEPRISPSR